MPRVENTGDNIRPTLVRTGNGASVYDVCKDCKAVLKRDPHALDHKLTPYNGEPQGDRGWVPGAAHPDYNDQDPPLTCDGCGTRLYEGRDGE